MTNEELTATLNTLRAEVAGKSRAHTATLKSLDQVLKTLRDPSKNAVALNEAMRKLRRDGEGNSCL